MKIRDQTQTALRMFLPPLLLLVLLTACIGPPDGRDINTIPVQEAVTSLADEGEPLAQALVQSDLFAEFALDNYPVSLIYITKEAFANYLAANGLTTEEFLTHPKLNAFLETLVIPNASIGFYDTKEGAFETVAGTTVVTSNKTFLPFAARTDMEINGVPVKRGLLCSIQSKEGGGPTATICDVTEPPSIFTW